MEANGGAALTVGTAPGGYVDDNFAQLKSVIGMSEFDCVRMAANSIRSSFASEERKTELLAELAASGR